MSFVGIIGRRVLYGAILLVAVLVLNFLLIRLAPGDAADYIAGQAGATTAEAMERLRADYGLDQPVHVQLYRYLLNAVQGDFGTSFYSRQPVVEIVLARLPATIMLVLSALVLALTLGTIFGVVAARNPNGWRSHAVTFMSLIGYSAPGFWVGIVLLIVFSYLVPLFPPFGMRTVPPLEGALFRAGDVALHLVLPAVTLAIFFMAQFSRLARASMLDVLGSDYVRTARAKGLSERVVVYKHALKNAALPLVTMTGYHFGNLFAGAVLIETVFSWPGMGLLAYDSVLRRDHPVLLAILVFAAGTVIVANLLTDFIYRLMDPRIREIG